MKEDDSNRPDITTNAVNVLLQRLGRHVNRRADIVIFVVMDVVDGDCEAEVSILVGSILVEYVGWLDVPMQEPCFMNIVISRDKLPHNFNSLEVRDCLALFDQPIQISFAQFSNKIRVIARGIDIVKMEYMLGMRKCLKRGHFKLKEHLIDGIFKLSHLDDLDAHFLPSLIVEAFVHGAAVTLADVLVDLVGVSLDGLHYYR